MYNIVLIEPEIPHNTGNIARTCSVTNTRLHLVGPLGFTIDNTRLKRAGLDYWDDLDITMYENKNEFFLKNDGGKFFFFSTKAARSYHEASYCENSYLIFGKETAGLGSEILTAYEPFCYRIPMRENKRSLNLSNSVAIVLFEALRQNGFKGFQLSGIMEQ